MSKIQHITKRLTKACGVKLIKAKSCRDSYKIGIHLLNPTAYELEDAIQKAESDLFPAVYIHTIKTFERVR